MGNTLKYPADYGITRIDPELHKSRTKGYEVRIRRKNKLICKLFSDNVYRGKTKALKEAKKYRDKILEENPPMTRKEFAERNSGRSKSGVVGVSLIKAVDKRGDKSYSYQYWQAYWSPKPGVHKSRKFSVNKYGYEKAFKLAKQARKKGLKEIEGVAELYVKKTRRKNKVR